MIKIAHTSDWHLGKILFGTSLIRDQRSVLKKWVKWVHQNEITHVLIAGDVFDRAVPPEEAVSLLSEILCDLTLDQGKNNHLQVMIISGNHDSRVRLGAFSPLLKRSNVLIQSGLRDALAPISLKTSDGKELARLFLLPYLEPQEVLSFARTQTANAADDDDESVPSHQSALNWYLQAIQSDLLRTKSAGLKALLSAHLFVGGAASTESERPLAIGGSELVSVDSFSNFDYVALGHLHRRQAFSLESGGFATYCGSLFPYSASEAGQKKSFEVITINDQGEMTCDRHVFETERSLVTFELSFEELMQLEPQSDYLIAHLTDASIPLDCAKRLKERHPNLLHVSRVQSQTAKSSDQMQELTSLQRTSVSSIRSDHDVLKNFIRSHSTDNVSDEDFNWIFENWQEYLKSQDQVHQSSDEGHPS